MTDMMLKKFEIWEHLGFWVFRILSKVEHIFQNIQNKKTSEIRKTWVLSIKGLNL
jgi:hypothetical protein